MIPLMLHHIMTRHVLGRKHATLPSTWIFFSLQDLRFLFWHFKIRNDRQVETKCIVSHRPFPVAFSSNKVFVCFQFLFLVLFSVFVLLNAHDVVNLTHSNWVKCDLKYHYYWSSLCNYYLKIVYKILIFCVPNQIIIFTINTQINSPTLYNWHFIISYHNLYLQFSRLLVVLVTFSRFDSDEIVII